MIEMDDTRGGGSLYTCSALISASLTRPLDELHAGSHVHEDASAAALMSARDVFIRQSSRYALHELDTSSSRPTD